MTPLFCNRRSATRRAAFCAAMALIFAFAAAPRATAADAPPPLSAIGSDKALWALVQQPATEDVAKVAVLHAPSDTAGDGLGVAARLTGKLMTGGLAAHGNTLWVVYRDGAIQHVTAEPTEMTPSGWQYRGGRVASLPEGAVLKAMTATQDGPVVLVRVESRDALQALDAPKTTTTRPKASDDREARRRVLLGLPPRSFKRAAEPQADASTEQPTAEDDTPPAAVSEDRLLRLEHGRWVVQPLPEDWASPKEAWLVPLSADQPLPVLLARDVTRSAELHIYTPTDTGWASTALMLPVRHRVTPLTIDQQLVLIQTTPQALPETAKVALARPPKTHDLGTLTTRAQRGDAWTATRLGAQAVLITSRPLTRSKPAEGGDAESPTPLKLSITGIDLQGVKSAPQVISMRTPSSMDRFAQLLMMLQLVSFAVVLVTMFWQRDAGMKPISLGGRWALADLTRRWTAAAVDLLPALGISVLLFDTSFVNMLTHWPGNQYGHTWEAIQPGVVAIGIFVAYTTVCELIFARTLGKLLLHIHITDRHGNRPKLWQLLVRNVFKLVDLVAWMLLLIPVLSPVNQRLGDLFAGTVITQAKKADETTPKQDDTSSS